MAVSAQHIYDGITEYDLGRMQTCFDMSVRNYRYGDKVCTFGAGSRMVGILLSGTASVMHLQPNGTQTMTEYLGPGDMFSEVFFKNAANPENYSIYCNEDARIQFFDFQHVFTPCSNSCSCHSHLIENMVLILSRKAVQLSERVEILSRRTTREKLQSCFNIMAAKNHSDTFTLPFTMSALAEYLSIDRSAMTREIRKLKEEGVLDIQKHTVHILEKDWLDA